MIDSLEIVVEANLASMSHEFAFPMTIKIGPAKTNVFDQIIIIIGNSLCGAICIKLSKDK